MTLSKIDSMILAELKEVSGNKKYKNKDVQEWSTSKETVKGNLRDGEKYFYLPNLALHIAVKELK